MLPLCHLERGGHDPHALRGGRATRRDMAKLLGAAGRCPRRGARATVENKEAQFSPSFRLLRSHLHRFFAAFHLSQRRKLWPLPDVAAWVQTARSGSGQPEQSEISRKLQR
jgi:hypothetical protein